MDLPVQQFRTKAEQELLDLYEGAEQALPGARDPFVSGLRQDAIRAYGRLGLPHRRIEAWKYTDLRARLTNANPLLKAVGTGIAEAEFERALGHSIMGLPAYRLVVVEGDLRTDLSDIARLKAAGVEAISLGHALEKPPAWLKSALSQVNPRDDDAVLALNTALMTGGAALRIGDGVLFYHSSCAEPGIAGLAQVASAPYPDPTQFDPSSPYHDGRSDPASPRWLLVDVKLQREALGMLEENIFSDQNFQFSPELLTKLGWSNWSHWGTRGTTRKDFGVHDFVLQWQERVLAQLLSSVTLSRMHDAELKVAADADALTVAELIERLTDAIFSEADRLTGGEYTNRQPAISSIRRNLQRVYLRNLAHLALGRTSAPEDAQTIAYAELSALKGRLDTLLERDIALDSYSRAHLQESSHRIEKVLDARMTQLP